MLRAALLALSLTACAGATRLDAVRVEKPSPARPPLATGRCADAAREDPPVAPTPDRSSAAPACMPTGAPSASSRAALRWTIRGHADEIRTCFDWELELEPTLAATVALQFVVEPSGSVSDMIVARLDPATLRTEHLAECMMRRVRTWQFPCVRQAGVDEGCRTTPSGVVVVTYPWRFRER